MGWSARFIADITAGLKRPRYAVETLIALEWRPLVTDLRLSSHAEPGYLQALGRTGSLSAGSLSTFDWTCTVSEMRVSFRGTADIRQSVARGTVVQVRMGFDGWSVTEFEPIFTGHVQHISRGPRDEWVIVIRSVVASLISRFTQSNTQTAIFNELPNETTLDEDYTAGESDVDIVSMVGTKETGGVYLLEITPTDGDPFMITSTGNTSTTLNGCSATGVLGTTAVDAVTGDAVRFAAMVDDNPVNGARKIICSTNVGGNGTYDVLPSGWGIGLPDAAIDHDDCDATATIVAPTSGSDDWWIYSFEPQDDALAWLQQVLGPGGMILCERQGRLSIRAATSPDAHPYGTEFISDRDIVAIERYDTWDPDVPVEYSDASVQASDGALSLASLVEDMDSRPASHQRITELLYVQENTTAWSERVRDRSATWRTRVQEVVDLTCVGWRLAVLAPGDPVALNSAFVFSRTRTEGLWIVLMVEPDWWGASTKVRLAFIPETASEF